LEGGSEKEVEEWAAIRQIGIPVEWPPLTRVTHKLQRRVPSSGENSPFDKCGFGFGFGNGEKVYRKERNTHMPS